MKLIKFIPWQGENSIYEYGPIKTGLPEWWKNGETTWGEDNTPGLKTCVPFMEIMMTGYLLRVPFDIYVTKNEEGNTKITWNSPDSWYMFVGQRDHRQGATIPRPAGHEPMGFTWASQWSWKTPRGYSTFVTHPFNRHDLPFTTLNAIVDSDKFHAPGNIPFFIKKDFQGIIHAGTPYAQIYPFKRDKWKSWIDDSQIIDIEQKQIFEMRKPGKSYKKKFWQKKEFN